MNIFLMGSNTIPPFIATLAHPKFEAASADVFQNGDFIKGASYSLDDMEVPTGRMFRYILQSSCTSGKNRKLVVDAGLIFYIE